MNLEALTASVGRSMRFGFIRFHRHSYAKSLRDSGFVFELRFPQARAKPRPSKCPPSK